MRPILLKGHERSITCVIYNRDGDLIFTSAKDGRPTLWLSESGERVGTYELHNGAVWHLDVSWDSKLLVSGSADMHAKVWDVETGAELASFEHSGPVRSSGCRTPEAGEVKCQIVRWMPLGKAILCAFEDGQIKIHDSLSFEEIKCVPAHDSKIQCVSFNLTQTMLLTASADQTCKMWDLHDWTELKMFRSDRPLNACGKFETQFFHLAYEEEFGRVKGHFGPINALAIAPDGKSFCSGAEGGIHRRRTS
ncbi:hypothetical protein JL721_10031 [Aureococcus anophagefferens]|nr:hypothetical protein JL721_10031 [Aureococcus anophagefferens]